MVHGRLLALPDRQEVLTQDGPWLSGWLFGFKDPEGQMARWLERLARFDFNIEHRPGLKHGNSDGLSRIPCEGTLQELPEGPRDGQEGLRDSQRDPCDHPSCTQRYQEDEGLN